MGQPSGTQHSPERQGHICAPKYVALAPRVPFPPLLCYPDSSQLFVVSLLLAPVLPVPPALPLPSPPQLCPLLPLLLVSLPSPTSVLSSVRSLYYFTSSLRQNFCFCPPFPRRGSGRHLPHTALQARGRHSCLLFSSKDLSHPKKHYALWAWLPGEARPGMTAVVACSHWVPAAEDRGQGPGPQFGGLPQVISPAQD